MSDHLPKRPINYNNKNYAVAATLTPSSEPVKISTLTATIRPQTENTTVEPEPKEYRYGGSLLLDQARFANKLLIDNKLKGIEDLEKEQAAAILEGTYWLLTSVNVGGKAVGFAKTMVVARGGVGFASGLANGYGVEGATLNAFAGTFGKISTRGYTPFSITKGPGKVLTDLGHKVHHLQDDALNALTNGGHKKWLAASGGVFSFTPGINAPQKLEAWGAKQVWFKPYYNQKKETKIIKSFEDLGEVVNQNKVENRERGDLAIQAGTYRNTTTTRSVEEINQVASLVKNFEKTLKPKNKWVERFERIMIPDKFLAYDAAKKFMKGTGGSDSVIVSGLQFTWDLTVGGLFDAINKYSDATYYKNKIKGGFDQNDKRDQQLAKFIVDLQNAGGKYISEINGDVIIVPPEPKKEEKAPLTTVRVNVADNTRNTRLQQTKLNSEISTRIRQEHAAYQNQVIPQKNRAMLENLRQQHYVEQENIRNWSNNTLGTNFSPMSGDIEKLPQTRLRDGRIVSGQQIKALYYAATYRR